MEIQIWSDVVCPWCAIGKANLDKAVEQWSAAGGGRSVEVTWRSFELDPGASRTPAGDVPYVERIAKKYGVSVTQAQQMVDRVEATGAEAGVLINSAISRPGNSFDAHRVIHLAAEHGIQNDVKTRFLRGYLTEGMPVSDHDALTEAAVEAGLDKNDVTDVLTSNRYADDVRADEQAAMDLGVTGVPFFVLDGRFAVPGAQSVDTLTAALERAWTTRAPQVLIPLDENPGNVCGPDGCA